MADMKAGDVRREKPRSMKGGAPTYLAAPFRIVRFQQPRISEPIEAVVVALDGSRERAKRLEAVAKCPLWPSEHEQYKDARGYEVRS